MTQETLSIALELRREGWPHEEIKSDDYYFAEAKELDTIDRVWLVYYGEELIGLTGIYVFDEDESGWDNSESVWMDWFMIKTEYRRQGFGKQVLLDTIQYCRELGRFKFFRLDTTFWEGRPALKSYDKIMEFSERYNAEVPDTKEGEYYLIYSLALHGDKMKPWGNQLLNLGGVE